MYKNWPIFLWSLTVPNCINVSISQWDGESYELRCTLTDKTSIMATIKTKSKLRTMNTTVHESTKHTHSRTCFTACYSCQDCCNCIYLLDMNTPIFLSSMQTFQTFLDPLSSLLIYYQTSHHTVGNSEKNKVWIMWQ